MRKIRVFIGGIEITSVVRQGIAAALWRQKQSNPSAKPRMAPRLQLVTILAPTL